MFNRIQPVGYSRFKHMLVGNKAKDGTKDVLDQDIANVESFVYLGVNLDNKLSFEKIVNGIISRVNGRLLTFARIRKLIDVYTSLAIYKQMILPILDYMSILVDSSVKSKVKKLQPLQNRAIRTIEKRSGYISAMEMNELHSKLNLKMLNERRKIFMLKLMYKLSRDIDNVNLYRPERILRTAPKVKIKLEFTDKERVKRSPYYVGNQLWDQLDITTQNAMNITEVIMYYRYSWNVKYV